MPANPKAASVRVLFAFFQYNSARTLNVIVNGRAHPTPWPYPDTQAYTWRTYAVTIPITDLVAGTNVVQLGSDQDMVTSNVNIVLVDVRGGVPILPGSNNAYPAGGTTGIGMVDRRDWRAQIGSLPLAWASAFRAQSTFRYRTLNGCHDSAIWERRTYPRFQKLGRIGDQSTRCSSDGTHSTGNDTA